MNKFKTKSIDDKFVAKGISLQETTIRMIRTEVYHLKPPSMIPQDDESVKSYVMKCKKLHQRANDFGLTEEVSTCLNYLSKIGSEYKK